MKVWKDKEGKKVTAKEFAQRFREGINNLTPKQKLQNDRNATFVSLVGFIMSLVALIVFRDQMPITWLTYGLILIFVGSVWSNLVKFFVLRQQVKAFSQFDSHSLDINEVFKGIEEGIDKMEKEENLNINKTEVKDDNRSI